MKKLSAAEEVTRNFFDGVWPAVTQIGIASGSKCCRIKNLPASRSRRINRAGKIWAVRCPKCHSVDVIFEHLGGPAGSKD